MQKLPKADIDSPLATVRQLIRDKDITKAQEIFTNFAEQEFGFTITRLDFDAENALALNSLRGAIDTQDGQTLFFKFHQESGEESRMKTGEYYKAEILEEAGFPIDMPLYKSTKVGEQIVIYPRVEYETFHDACRALEKAEHTETELEKFSSGYDEFQKILGQKYIETLHEASAEQNTAETYHTLIYRRLVDTDGDTEFGGRYKEFYQNTNVPLPDGSTLSFKDFSNKKWIINGISYDLSLAHAFMNAKEFTNPRHCEKYAAVIAHGDDHTGNLWWLPDAPKEKQLRYFDPAFAGEHIPALQAAKKALFHVNFAHQDWLYDPADLDIEMNINVQGDTIHVEHNWDLPPLRERFLSSQLEHVFKPLLAEMKKRDMLPDDWEDIMRSTLFCCPILCKNLIAGRGEPNPQTPEASMLGFAISIMLASAPESGHDRVSKFMTELRNSL